MSILIKGMEMPQECDQCPFFDDCYDYPTCDVTQRSHGYNWNPRGQRMPECPLIEVPTWIPMTERLPEHLTSVIVHRKDGGIFIWEYFDTSQTDECWIDDRMNVYSFYDVTHWMPLPESPKGETK